MSVMYTPDIVFRLVPWFGPLTLIEGDGGSAGSSSVPTLMLLGLLS